MPCFDICPYWGFYLTQCTCNYMEEDYSDKQLVASRWETFQDVQVGDNLWPDRNKVTFPVENAHYDCERMWIKAKSKTLHLSSSQFILSLMFPRCHYENALERQITYLEKEREGKYDWYM
jgi:hypothetical protein